MVLALLLLAALPAAAETVEILRDPHGAPHIFATTPAGAAFGAGYAQAEDRADALLKNLTGDGPLDAAPLPPELQAIVDAYAAGVNRALGAEKVRSTQVAVFARSAYAWIQNSNDLILGPTRTTSRSVIAVLDPIADWNRPDRPYEMSLYASQGDLAIAGVAPVGMPFPVVGHSQHVAIGWSGSNVAGPRALEQAWALITARDLAQLRQALAMNQIPGRTLCGTSAGDLCEPSSSGFLGGTHPVTQEALRVQNTWPFGRVQTLAFNTDVYKADVWQRYLARVAPESRFARILTGWNRRADADSRAALAFYLFKMALERDASALEPPDSLSLPRLRTALQRAQDRMETELDFNANWGSEFRITRDGSRASFPTAAGVLPEAGIDTPRTLRFRNGRAYAGQAATRIVELGRTPSAVSILLPGVSDDPQSKHFEDQAALTKPKDSYFRDRRSLERVAVSRKRLEF